MFNPASIKVREAALVGCRGKENLALRIGFSRPLAKEERVGIMANLTAFAMQDELFEPHFDGDTVYLHPATGQGKLGQSDYLDVLNHLGITVVDLPISGTLGCCSTSDQPEEIGIVFPAHPFLH